MKPGDDHLHLGLHQPAQGVMHAFRPHHPLMAEDQPATSSHRRRRGKPSVYCRWRGVRARLGGVNLAGGRRQDPCVLRQIARHLPCGTCSARWPPPSSRCRGCGSKVPAEIIVQQDAAEEARPAAVHFHVLGKLQWWARKVLKGSGLDHACSRAVSTPIRPTG